MSRDSLLATVDSHFCSGVANVAPRIIVDGKYTTFYFPFFVLRLIKCKSSPSKLFIEFFLQFSSCFFAVDIGLYTAN